MRFGSVCSGIEAATVAWSPLGWTPAFYSEIDPRPSKVLAHHYPETPNLGDFTKIGPKHAPEGVDLLAGGTPCQAFSVAGERRGLADPRGNLTLEFVRLARRLRPRWLFWENVPGVLSSDGGRAFGAFLGALGESGYGFAYRVFDAQHFGIPQRRRRVFVVGYLGDWRPPAAVLFEPGGGGRNPYESGTAGQEIAGSPARGARAAGPHAYGTDLCPTVTSKWSKGYGGPAGDECQNMLIQPPEAFLPRHYVDPRYGGALRSIPGTITATAAKAWDTTWHTLNSGIVRRFSPRETERLMGFPDDYTAMLADGARYHVLGNSWAVPVVRWIGEQIAIVEELIELYAEGQGPGQV